MSDPKVAGACLCGAVRFEAQLPSLFCVHCHCSMCRRNHGAGFVTWFTLPRERLEIVEGADAVRRYASSSHAHRTFCGHCGSSLFFESETRPDQVDIALANMEDAIDRVPELHIHFDDRAAWVEVHDALPRLGGATGFEPLEAADGE